MLNLTTNYKTAVGSTRTQPAFLFQVIYSDIRLRITSGPTLSCTIDGSSDTWVNSPLKISGLSADLSANFNGRVEISIDSSTPETLMAMALSNNRGFADKVIKIWTYDNSLVSGGVLQAEDTVLIFDGIGNDTQITPTNISISVVSGKAKNLFAPRMRICKENGFNYLQPKGTRITWGSEIFILE